jgi:hypothetical protein
MGGYPDLFNHLLGVLGASHNISRQIIIKTIVILITLVTTALGWPALAGEKSPITSPEIGTNSSPKAVEAAKLQGATTASKDIKAGELRILHFGQPWSKGKPLVDEATGYRVQIVGGCVVTKAFVAEVTAYNQAMRDWHTKTKKPEPSQKR